MLWACEKFPIDLQWENGVSKLARSFLIGYSSNLLVTRIGKKSQLSSNSGRIGLVTSELPGEMWCATPVTHRLFWNLCDVFCIEWRCACGLDIILWLFVLTFLLCELSFFRCEMLSKCIDKGFHLGTTPYSFPPIVLKLCIWVSELDHFVIASNAYSNQQPIKIKDWFSHFKDFACAGNLTTADLFWLDHGCSFPLKSSSCGHSNILEIIRHKIAFAWLQSVMAADQEHSNIPDT